MSAMASGIKEPKGVEALRKVAMRFPGTQEGISCNKVAFNAGKKAFLFIGVGEASYDAMLKLGDSRPEAAALAAREPGRCKVGGTGWVTITFGRDEAPPKGLLERWIDESFRMLAPRALVEELSGAPSAGRGKGEKRK